MDDNIIIKGDAATARELVPNWQNKLKKVHIKDGAGSDDYPMIDTKTGSRHKIPATPSLCIMEATAWVLGYGEEGGVHDSPPCTSETIRQVLISLNDSITSNRNRAQLKHVIPHIVNTAPTKWIEVKGQPVFRTINGSYRNIGKKPSTFVLATFEKDLDYRVAERQRRDILKKFRKDNNLSLDGRYSDMCDAAEMFPMKTWIDLVIELANVAHFAGRNKKTDVVQLPPLFRVVIPRAPFYDNDSAEELLLEKVNKIAQKYIVETPQAGPMETGGERDAKPSQENPSPEAMESIQRGLEQARKGELTDGPDSLKEETEQKLVEENPNDA